MISLPKLPKILAALTIPFRLKKCLLGAYFIGRGSSPEAVQKMALLHSERLRREIEGQVSYLIRGGVAAEGLAEYRATLDRLRVVRLGDLGLTNPLIVQDAQKMIDFFDGQISRLDRRIDSMRS